MVPPTKRDDRRVTIGEDFAFTSREDGARFAAWFDSSSVRRGDLWDQVEAVPLSRVYVVADECRRRAKFWEDFADAVESHVSAVELGSLRPGRGFLGHDRAGLSAPREFGIEACEQRGRVSGSGAKTWWGSRTIGRSAIMRSTRRLAPSCSTLADERRLAREADRGRTLECGPWLTAGYVERQAVLVKLHVSRTRKGTGKPSASSRLSHAGIWLASTSPARAHASRRSPSVSPGSAELQEPDPTPRRRSTRLCVPHGRLVVEVVDVGPPHDPRHRVLDELPSPVPDRFSTLRPWRAAPDHRQHRGEEVEIALGVVLDVGVPDGRERRG